MLGTGGAAKVVNDMASLADIARAIGDSSKADKLQSIRDEFKKSLDELVAQEKKAQDKFKEAQDAADVNSVTWSSLDKWEKDLAIRTKGIENKEKTIEELKLQLEIQKEELKAKDKALDKDRNEFLKIKDSMVLSLKVAESNNNTAHDKRSKELDRRERLVAERETNAANREINIFKQSQIAQAFIKSVG